MRFILVALLGGFLLVGCSKKEAAAPEVSESTESKAAAAEPMIEASLEDVTQKIANQQYDAAVGSLVAVGSIPKSDAQQTAYMRQVREVNNALAEKVAQGDQKAWESQQMLNRMMIGR
jgi:hypothetical protein